jgi:selenide,water dikinase
MIRLTQTVKKGGCAAKLPAGQLKNVLKNLNLPTCSELIVGTENLDDAALWDLSDNRLLVQTLDFFTPIVDDPFDFGAIAAANAISDVYAMGGKPVTALSILAFPTVTLPIELIEPLMQGALSIIQEAGAYLAGGHTIDDETLKLGFSVTGFVNKNRAWKNTGAAEGDYLILTKALGTGTITSALKNDVASSESVAAAIASMKTLNKVPELIENISVHAATDITGFGLAGHLLQLARASNKSIEVFAQKLPVLDGALKLLEKGTLNRAHKTNLEYTKDAVQWQVSDALKWLTLDPQTSGGLVLSVAEKNVEEVIEQLKGKFSSVSVIGKVGPQVVDDSSVLRFV